MKRAQASAALAAVLALGVHSLARADATPVPKLGMPSANVFTSLCRTILIAEQPFPIEERDNWGKTVKIFDGVKVEGKGLRLKIRESKKDVNHGLWKHFKITLDDPEKDLSLEVRRFEHVGGDRFVFEVFLSARLHAYAHLMQWSNGLRLLSTEVEADATLELSIAGEVRVGYAPGLLMPTVSLDPKIADARLNLGYFRMRRVGQFDGWAVKELGETLESMVRRKIRDKSPKIVESANEAITKQKQAGKLQFSAADLWPKKITP